MCPKLDTFHQTRTPLVICCSAESVNHLCGRPSDCLFASRPGVKSGIIPSPLKRSQHRKKNHHREKNFGTYSRSRERGGKKKKAGGGGRRLEFTGKGNLTGHRYQPWQGRQAQGWEKKSGKVKKGIAWEGKNKKI